MRYTVFGLALLLLVTSASSAQLAETKIAFSSNRDGNQEIYVMNADGTNPINLTNNPANDLDPFASPDGTKIAFSSNRDGDDEIYVMNADGTNPVNLTNNLADDRGRPIWSPDGTQIFFSSNRDGNQEIYVMNADGSNPVNLTNNPAEDNSPSWFSTRPMVGVSPREKLATTWGRLKATQ